MDVEIKNSGPGGDIGAHVDQNNQLHVFANIHTGDQHGTGKGNAYNINTGIIGLTSTSDSAVLYFKNDESPVNGESDFHIDAIAVGVGVGDAGATQDEKTIITVIRNPTTGTIVSGATDVDMNANRHFGSSDTLSITTLAYKGAEANTFTDGEDLAQFFQSGARGFYAINLIISRGASIGININTNTSAGTTDVYVALIGHRADGANN